MNPLFERDTPYLTGHLLVAMPAMPDTRFERAVIFVCVHNAEGAMGLVINQHADSIGFRDLLEQLSIPTSLGFLDYPVHAGGPVETGRGFVLHSDDFIRPETMALGRGFAMTATVDVLRAMADGSGPQQSLMALGYAGWGAGQLDAEIQANGWLTVPADKDLVFQTNISEKWDRALSKIGISPALLSSDMGHA